MIVGKSVKMQNIRMRKCENKLFACRVEDLHTRSSELNKLLEDGWLTEETQIVGNMYLALLKKEGEGKKVFYVDVSGMTHEEAHVYMERVKQLMSDPDPDGDFYIGYRS